VGMGLLPLLLSWVSVFLCASFPLLSMVTLFFFGFLTHLINEMSLRFPLPSFAFPTPVFPPRGRKKQIVGNQAAREASLEGKVCAKKDGISPVTKKMLQNT